MSKNGKTPTKVEKYGPVLIDAKDGRTLEVFPIPFVRLGLGKNPSTRRAWGWRVRNAKGRLMRGQGTTPDQALERCKAVAAATKAAGPGAKVRAG